MLERFGLTKRIKAATDVFKNGYPHRVSFVETKKSPYVWPDFRLGRPEWHLVDLQSYVQHGFNENSLIYSAIMYKVRASSLAPLRAYTGNIDSPESLPPNNALSQLVTRPNLHQSWVEFQGLNIVYFNIAGNVYIMLDRQRRKELPKAMYSLRPDRVYIVPGNKGTQAGVKGYLYVPENKGYRDGIPILPEDMIHIKIPNPNDPLEGLGYGLSPISSIARSVDVDNSVTHFLQLFFQQGSMVTGLLKFDVPLDNATVSRIKERWKEQYGGFEKWDIGVLDQGGSYERTGLTFEEMGFSDLDSRNETRVLGPFGVPGILIGTKSGLDRSTYANFESARKAFWEDTLVPENNWFLSDLSYYLQDGNDFVLYDYSEVPALQKDTPALVESWSMLVDRGIHPDDAAETVGLRLVRKRQDEVIQIEEEPVEEEEVEEDTNEGAVEAESDDRIDKNIKSLSPEKKLSFATKSDKLAESWEDKFGESAKQAFEHDKREILAIINERKQKALQNKQSINWLDVSIDVIAYIEGLSEDEWRKLFIPVIQGVMTDQIQNIETELGLGINFNLRNFYAEQWFDQYIMKFAQPINDTTSKDIAALLRQAEEEGWSIDSAINKMELVFQHWMNGDLSAEDFEWLADRMPEYRRAMIARTESMRALNAGTFQTYLKSGVKRKSWLATADDRTRPTHVQADRDYGEDEKSIPIGQYFLVGSSYMLYPLDPFGPVEEVVNCRCSLLPVVM